MRTAPRDAARAALVPGASAEMVVGRYGELWLKGGNRRWFERILIRNLKAALEPIAPVRIERRHGQVAVHAERRIGDVARRMQDVFGLSSLSPAWGAEPEFEAIATVAGTVLRETLAGLPTGDPIPFRVETRRADKRFPIVSIELDRRIADRVMPEHEERLRVDLSRPELTLGIHVQHDRVHVYAASLRGAGGLPVGTLGRAVCLLSGGIDSPVAAWLTMKRGCEVVFVTFHSYPYVGESARRKVERLVRLLQRWQPRALLYSVPFTEIQTAIRDGCREDYRTVLYRRMMHRVAERVAARERAGAVVTGDSLGQVASQTLENLTCIEAACTLPLLRPLICYDKIETMDLARRIGTYELSILPEPDCCTVFQPDRPIIRGRPHHCAEAEAALDVEGLVEKAVAEADRQKIG